MGARRPSKFKRGWKVEEEVWEHEDWKGRELKRTGSNPLSVPRALCVQREGVKEEEGGIVLIAVSIRSPNKLLVAWMAIRDVEI